MLDSTASIPLQQQRHLSASATGQKRNAAVSCPAVCALFGCLGRLLEFQSKGNPGSSTPQANHARDRNLPGLSQRADTVAAGVSGNKAGDSSDAIENDAMSGGNGSDDGSRNSSSSGNKAGDSSDASESDAMSDGIGSDDGSRNSSSSDAVSDRQESGLEAVQEVAPHHKERQPQAVDPGVADGGPDAVLGRALEGHVRDLRMMLSKPWRLSAHDGGGTSGR